MKNSTQSLMPRGGTQANENRRSGFPSGATTQYLALYFSATYAYFQDRGAEESKNQEGVTKVQVLPALFFGLGLWDCASGFSRES